MFGLTKAAQLKRDDLWIIVTSATLDAHKFSTYFNDCIVFWIPGWTYGVECFFAREPSSDYLEDSI